MSLFLCIAVCNSKQQGSESSSRNQTKSGLNSTFEPLLFFVLKLILRGFLRCVHGRIHEVMDKVRKRSAEEGYKNSYFCKIGVLFLSQNF